MNILGDHAVDDAAFSVTTKPANDFDTPQSPRKHTSKARHAKGSVKSIAGYDEDVDSDVTEFSQRKKGQGKNYEKKLFKNIDKFIREAKDSKEMKTSDLVKEAITVRSFDPFIIGFVIFI